MVTADSDNELSGENESSDDLLFTLLREEATDVDSFEDKTHEKIAETLYRLIKKEKRGLTIGLEGTWGSGKSVVISILRKKLNDEQKIVFFSFDAWAHEGDPLRRSFLESLVEELQRNNRQVSDLHKRQLSDVLAVVSKRTKHCVINTKRSGTVLGRWLAVSAFCVPLGLGFMPKVDFTEITFHPGMPHWFFLLSLSLLAAPVLVLGGRLIHLLWKALETNWKGSAGRNASENSFWKKIFSAANWAFMQGESTEDATQDTSEDEERSSIEFEKYFQKIMTILFDGEPEEKLVMVVDNLDRVDARDSLKIWSTLQTFLQQRNTPSNKKHWFEGIWVIVPYDPEGLAKLWDKSEEKEEPPKKSKTVEQRKERVKEKLSSQFFDKCFQLKLEVPKPVLTAWEQFARDKINEAFPKWDSNERKKVLDILELTRKTLNDIPTPRQIKNYINQVGLLRMHSSIEIPTESIAYYVVQRILEKNTVDKIREKLLSRELPETLINQFLPESCSRDMAGLVFGVSSVIGEQLLLEPDIQNALRLGDGDKLRELQEQHLDGFWAVFSHHIQKIELSLEELLPYSKAIHNGLWKVFKEKVRVFSTQAETVINNNREYKWAKKEQLDSYSCLSVMLYNRASWVALYKAIVFCLDSEIGENNQFDMREAVGTLQELVKIFKIDTQFKLFTLTIDKFIQWAQASVETNVPAWNWIVPKEPLAAQISSKIPQGSIIPPGLRDAFIYLVKANSSENWSGLVSACQKHIQHNNGVGARNTHSKEIFEILFTLAFNYEKYDAEIKNLANDWRFYNLAWHLHNQILTPQIGLLCGKYLGNQLNTFAPNPSQPNVVSFANALKVYWNNHNKDNANVILDLLKEYNKWDLLWNLAEDSRNKLVADIILLALKDAKAKTLFSTNNGLRKIAICFDLFGDRDTESINLLVKALIKHSSLEKEVVKDAELNIIESSKELYYIVELSSNSQLITYLGEKVREQSKEVWSNALKKDTYLTSLAVAVKQKDSGFGLDNHYADALIDFVKSAARGTYEFTDWQKDFWQKLICLMGDAFQVQYRGDLTEFMMAEHAEAEVSNEFIELNSKYFVYGKMRQNVEGTQNILRNAINAKDFPRLRWLNESVLFPEKGKQFKQQKHFSEIIKNPLNSLLQEEHENGENVTLIKELAARLQVELIEAVREEQNDELEKILISCKWRLFYNPDKKAGAFKIMCFDKEGVILEGKNDNESSWRVQNELLELVDSDGEVHSRFKYDSRNKRFDHTNDPDTGSILKHSIRNQYMISEA